MPKIKLKKKEEKVIKDVVSFKENSISEEDSVESSKEEVKKEIIEEEVLSVLETKISEFPFVVVKKGIRKYKLFSRPDGTTFLELIVE